MTWEEEEEEVMEEVWEASDDGVVGVLSSTPLKKM